MDSTRFDRLAKSLTASASRRGITRPLAGLALAVAPLPRLGLTAADAKKKHKRKKKRRRNRPFCAGKNSCEANNSVCSKPGADEEDACFCWIKKESGDPFCGQQTDELDCSACAAGETCIDLTECGVVAEACATPCPDPRKRGVQAFHSPRSLRNDRQTAIDGTLTDSPHDPNSNGCFPA